MLRRLYFLFPDAEHAQSVVKDLFDLKVPRHRIHALAGKGVDLQHLPGATIRQKSDTLHHVVWLGWKFNLLLFSLAVIAFIAGVQSGHT